MNKEQAKKLGKTRRAARVRAKVWGTAERPRLSVFKSNAHIFAQIINDDKGVTLASAHTKQMTGKKTEASLALGKALAERATAKGVKQVVFDRGGNLYHGRIKAVADGARAGGLDF